MVYTLKTTSEERHQEYLLQKATGYRNANGTMPLKRLRPKYEVILQLHMNGVPNTMIARNMGITEQRVSQILNDPLIKAHAKAKIDELDIRFLALKGKAIDAISDALDFDQDIDVRLSAADKWLKAHGYFEKKGGGAESASLEDVVQRLVNAVQVNVNVNTGNSNGSNSISSDGHSGGEERGEGAAGLPRPSEVG